MNRRSGRPRRNNSFLDTAREWISDNLRYLIIAAAAVIVALIVIFAVKASHDKKNPDSASAGTAVTGTPSASEWKKGSSTTITVTPSAQQPQTSGTAVSGYPSLDVPGTVITYLDAVAYGDVDTASAYSENIDESTVAVIEAGHPFSEFNSIYVYEYPGAKDGEYVAVTSFEYTERATGNVYPGIGAYYLVTGSDGIIRMASTATTEANQKTIDEVVNTPEVQQIIANVNAEYEAVIAQQQGQLEEYQEEAQPEEYQDGGQENADQGAGEDPQPEDTGEGGGE